MGFGLDFYCTGGFQNVCVHQSFEMFDINEVSISINQVGFSFNKSGRFQFEELILNSS